MNRSTERGQAHPISPFERLHWDLIRRLRGDEEYERWRDRQMEERG